MTRMFTIPTTKGDKVMRTWNIFVGCRFDCIYCNAKKAALTRFRNVPRYRAGFVPHLVEEELGRKFRPGDFVFVAYMGDISWATEHIIDVLLNKIAAQPEVDFLFCTKNPGIYTGWDRLPANLYLGVTIETNRGDKPMSKAPPAAERYRAMKSLAHPKKLISIEPVCDFDLVAMLKWMDEIRPEIVEVGADNYHNRLVEPRWEKVQALLAGLRGICPVVVEKAGLRRLEKEGYGEKD